jgi:BRCA1 C Terminus (BRCT) domain
LAGALFPTPTAGRAFAGGSPARTVRVAAHGSGRTHRRDERDREVWEQRAHAAGLVIGKNVTKKTVRVVAGDLDSLSGRSRKARDYMIPIVTEDAFAGMISVMPTTAGALPRCRPRSA